MIEILRNNPKVNMCNYKCIISITHCWILMFWISATTFPHCHSKTFPWISSIHGQNNVASLNTNYSTPTATTIRDPTTPPTTTDTVHDISIGPCTWAIGRKCPDKDVRFYLYTRKNIMDRQCLHIDDTLEKSNLTSSFFNVRHPTKIVIHGYNADMFLNPLHIMREEYLAKGEYNMVYVDWSVLAPGPCYISAVHNTKHAGACVAQLVERIRDYGSSDVHVIGFSLGAQLANYIARNLGSFLLPRITGLDPAMPLFITASASDKLDHTDAEYVDVIHTNALVQGKLERCGHADFYMNGGIMQPGCYSAGTNPFACSHQRAPAYFVESIRSHKGFWGWACSSYMAYLLGMCPPTNYLMEAGDNVRRSTKGMFLIDTNDTSPYALGKWTDLPILGLIKRPYPTAPTLTLTPPRQSGDPLLRQIDLWGKLDSSFNNLPEFTGPTSQNWHYFSSSVGSSGEHHLEGNSVEEQSLEEDDDKTPAVNWTEYRKNLTEGIIENSIFQIPRIKGIRT